MIGSIPDPQLHALARVRGALPEAPMVLIGAAALGLHVPMTWRRTADVDVGVIADATRAEEALERAGLQRHPTQEQRWFDALTRTQFDILAVSESDVAAGRLVFSASGFEMNLVGFELAFRHGLQLALPGHQSVAVAPASVLAVLKMAAWLDRNAERDLEDIGYLVARYLEADDLRRWEDPRLAQVSDFEEQPALALGFDMAEVMEDKHRLIVSSFLDRVSQEDSVPFERLSRAAGFGHADPGRALTALLGALQRGLGGTAR